METTHTPAGSGAGQGLHFTNGDGSDINEIARGGGAPRANSFEQKETLSMSNDSTPAKSGVGQVNSVRSNRTNKPVEGSGRADMSDYVSAAVAKIKNQPKAQGVRFNAKSPDWAENGQCEALGRAVEQLKVNDSQEQREKILAALQIDYSDMPGQVELLKSLGVALGNGEIIHHEALPVEFGGRRIGATRADFLKVRSSTRYAWPGWIIGGAVNAIAANGGVGKSRFVFDLCARVYRGTEWPDGTPIDESMKGKAALWIPSDGNYEQLFELIDSYELPDDSTIFIGTPDEPYGPTNLDSSDTAAFIREIVESRPIWAVIIDTIARCTTSPNPYGDEVLTRMLNPLRALLEPMGIPLIVLSHLNKEGVLKGRTLIGAARSVIMMTDEPGDKKRIYVDKTQGIKPQHLVGVMRDDSFSFEPAPEPVNRTEPPRLKGPEKTAYDYLLNSPGSTFQEIVNHVASSIDGNVERAKQAFYRMKERAGATKDDSKPPKWFLQDHL